MKKYFTYLIFMLVPLWASAQLITTDPALPTADDSVTITFDATQGDQGLMGYTGDDVYAYTGVTTSAGNWQHVKESSWLDNPADCQMKRIATDKYQLTISPSIRAFYGVPDTQQITQLSFVFRNSNGSVSGRDVGGADIFVPVYAVTLNVSFVTPATPFTLANDNQAIPIKVSATLNDSIRLYLDGVKIKSDTGQTLIDTVYATGNTLHKLVSVAYSGTDSVTSDTVSYLVQGTTQIASLPAGVHDGINYINDSTVTFVLFAPYKKSVYLIGDFNNWTPSAEYQMKEDTTAVPNPGTYNAVIDASGDTGSVAMVKDSDRFWITVKGLTPGKQYIFQYLIDGSIRIADPYSAQVSIPTDNGISSTIYPNLISYPTGKTTGIAGVIQTAQTPYNWKVTSFTPPDKSKLVIYELLIRDFTANKDIKTVMDSLSYLKRLGVNAIELMPFNEFEGNDSWGYNPSFYFAPDKAYGTPNDYKTFIDSCHQNGIAVIQDMVLDFSTGSSPLVQMYFANGDPSIQNPWYNVVPPVGSYTATQNYGYDFNHESPYVQQFTDSVTSYWMKEYKVDGFRFDMAKGWTNTSGSGDGSYDQPRINIFKATAGHMWEVNPNAYVILELFTGNREEDTLSSHEIMVWGNLNYNYEQASIGNGGSLSGISYKSLGWPNPTLVGYMESHDEEREMVFNETLGKSGGVYNIKDTTTALKRMELDNTFFLTVPGPKMIWQFGELGYDTSINYNGRVGDKPLLWKYYNDSRRRHLFNVVSSLIKLKETYPVFSTTNYSTDLNNQTKHIELAGKDTTVEIVGNFDVYGNSYTLTFPSTGKWYEYFTGDTLNVTNTSYQFTLNPGEYRMYSNYRFAGSGSLATPVKRAIQTDGAGVYPNPFRNDLYVKDAENIMQITLYNVQGQQLLQMKGGNGSEIQTENLNPGMYFLNLTYKNGTTEVLKVVKSE